MEPLVIDIETYGGLQVAIVDGKIVATGKTLKEVIDAARKKFPSLPLEEIKVLAVPPTINVIYHVSSDRFSV